MGQQPLVGQGLLIIEASRSHSLDTPHSVGLFWTNNQPDTETLLPDNTQHSQQTNIHAPSGIRTHNPIKQAAANPRLRARGHSTGGMFWRDSIFLNVVLSGCLIEVSISDSLQTGQIKYALK